MTAEDIRRRQETEAVTQSNEGIQKPIGRQDQKNDKEMELLDPEEVLAKDKNA